MAAFSDAAIRTAVSDVIVGVITGVRSMGVGNLTDDIAVGATSQTAAQRATVKPTVTISTAYTPHPDAPSQPGPDWFDTLTLTLTFTSLLPTEALGRVAIDLVKATQANGAANLRAAFAWPGKLTTTNAGVATGIVSGVLRFEGMTVVRDTPPTATDGGLYVTEHRFSGTVHSAVSVT